MEMIIDPFNGVFFGSFGLFIVALIVASLLLRKKSERTRELVLAFSMIGACLVFIWYKIMLSLDADYSVILVENNISAFNWWKELPLQLCNINMILIPVAVFTKNDALKGFSFFMGPLGALMALIMPATGFHGYSLLLPRNLGYYITHYMVFVGAIALASFKLYRPTYKKILPAFLALMVVSLFTFGVNMLLRVTGAAQANYFYSVETEGNVILEFFHNLIPVPFLYLVPAGIIIGLPYMFLVTTGFVVADKIKAKKQAKAES